jgi:hypothetical protein
MISPRAKLGLAFLLGEIDDAELDKLANAGDRLNMAQRTAQEKQVRKAGQPRPKKITELTKLADDVERAETKGQYGEWKQKREELKEALKAMEQEKAAFTKRLHDPQRQRNMLDDLGNQLIELAREIANVAVDKGQPAVARKVEARDLKNS